MRFLIIPAVDLKDGKCVQLVGGDTSKLLFSSDDPVEIARKWEKEGAGMLHVIDLDGAISGVRRNEEIVFRILEEVGIPVEFGGGIRSFEDASLFLNAGVYRVILGTSALLNPGIIEELSSSYSSERIMVAVELRGGKPVIKGWREELQRPLEDVLKDCEAKGAGSILFTSVDVEGRLSGIDLDGAGVIVGSSLYTGKISLREALEVVK